MSLRITNLTKIHPGGRKLFQGLNLEVKDHEFIAIVGPSGCGKSSLLRLVSGIDQPSSGTITGVPDSIGFVFQEPRLLSWRTTRENLLLPLELKGKDVPESRLYEVLKLVRLADSVLDLFPHQLSGGMKMRVALARALMSEPQILLMDEPLAALDESTRQILQEEIARIHEVQKLQTLFVTHSLSEALFLADRIVILGSSGELKNDFKVPFARPRLEALRSDAKFVDVLRGLQFDFRRSLTPEAGSI